MRHQKKTLKLGLTAAHRKALLANQVCSLIEHERIQTTLAKAKAVTQKTIPVKILPRRKGDPARLVADVKKINRVLGWKPRRTLDDVLQSAWVWEQTK